MVVDSRILNRGAWRLKRVCGYVKQGVWIRTQGISFGSPGFSLHMQALFK
jgi:hypothetical protein